MSIVAPKKLFMPAEWETHRGLLMEWPAPDDTWAENLGKAKTAFANVAIQAGKFEPVTMIAKPGEKEEVITLCGGGIEVIEIPHDDCWARDNCPTFVKDENGILTAVNWQFNAWGCAYPCFELDNLVPERLCDHWGIPRIDAPLILEGGSIHTNGAGTILTTAECLLNKNRNPALSQTEIEETVLSFVGGSKMIWLPYGIFADETSGHIDNICCFLGKDTVLLCWTDDPADENYERVRLAYHILKENGLQVEKSLQPPRHMHLGNRMPLSYVNYVYVNGGLLLPGFGGSAEETDKRAAEQLKSLFPGREIVQLPTMDIIKGGGNIHCITQQIPL